MPYVSKGFIDNTYRIYPQNKFGEGQFVAVLKKHQDTFNKTKTKTTFKLWAPTAVLVNISIAGTSYNMKRTEKGVYEITLRGDYENMKYHYYI